MSAKKPRTAAIPTIKRLPLYLRSLRDLQMQGEVFASSAALAKKLMFDPVVVRKDLAITGVVGTPRLGFPVDELISAIVDFLGWQNLALRTALPMRCLSSMSFATMPPITRLNRPLSRNTPIPQPRAVMRA